MICLAMLVCNYVAAGASIAAVATAMDFFPEANPALNPLGFSTTVLDRAISKIAYFFTTTALVQGVGNFVWVPVANKYGRRPTYIISYVIYLVCCKIYAARHAAVQPLAALRLGFCS